MLAATQPICLTFRSAFKKRMTSNKMYLKNLSVSAILEKGAVVTA